ncbi:MAG: hypothetical protein WC511_02055 [Candidatus Pacearchaeota archaeon]
MQSENNSTVPETVLKAVEKYFCPGCMQACNRGERCQNVSKSSNWGGFTCSKHHPGTFIGGLTKIYLGFPRGFNKVPAESPYNIKPEMVEICGPTDFNHLNIPVWALEDNGNLFVKYVSPRTNVVNVLIYLNLTLEKFREIVVKYPVIDVSEFVNQID